MGTFWNCVCELLSKPQEEISTTMLSLPAIGDGIDVETSLQRFAIVVELIRRRRAELRPTVWLVGVDKDKLEAGLQADIALAQ